MRGTTLFPGLAALLPLLGMPVLAQEPTPAPPPAAAEPAPPKPKPRPKPKPKPKVEPGSKAESPAELRTDTTARESETDQAPALRTRPLPAAEPQPAAPANDMPAAKDASPPSPSRGAFAAPPVACDPGRSVLYDGPKNTSLWVTRTGTVTIDNPLRPLTPDTTRVLQIVIGGKLATAYGPDLNALRRGAAPGALEAALGGPIHWDKALGTLPDVLNIVADSGATIAELRFKECGDAPAPKAGPVAKARKDGKAKQANQTPGGNETGAAATPAPPGGAAGASPPRKFNLPQGAIPQ